MTRSPLRPLLVVLAALALVLAPGLTAASAAPTPAPTNPSGFLRVGHLAPEVGAVAVQLIPAGGTPELVVEKAPYGAISDYSTLTPGGYTLAMRPVGADTSTPPLLSADVSIEPGVAYTVLVTGEPGALVTSVVNDDLVAPAADMSRVRLIQGSPNARTLTVEAVDGPLLARDVEYGTTTGYADVPQGRWTLRVTGEDGQEAMLTAPVVDLAAGSTNSLVVTDAPDGGFAIDAVLDAAGLDPAAAPAGGVETGAGGSAPVLAPAWTAWTVAAALSLVTLLLVARPVTVGARAARGRV